MALPMKMRDFTFLVDDTFIARYRCSLNSVNSKLRDFIHNLDFDYVEVLPVYWSGDLGDFPHQSAMFVSQASYASADYYIFINNYFGGKL